MNETRLEKECYRYGHHNLGLSCPCKLTPATKGGNMHGHVPVFHVAKYPQLWGNNWRKGGAVMKS